MFYQEQSGNPALIHIVLVSLRQELTVLYPDVSKDVFKKFCSAAIQGQTSKASDGYVQHKLVTQVEG
jgi:hypothetical protein